MGERERIPVTAPARTLLDLAAAVDEHELAPLFEEAQVRRLVSRGHVQRLVERHAGRRGVATLRAVVECDEAPSLTRSQAEALMLTLRAARLPLPLTNRRVGPHEVDMLWPAQRLVVEIDGYAFHASRARFERDRWRDAWLQVAGYHVLRITWRRLTDEGPAVVALVAGALARADAARNPA